MFKNIRLSIFKSPLELFLGLKIFKFLMGKCLFELFSKIFYLPKNLKIPKTLIKPILSVEKIKNFH